jgi:hypothetical protein
MIFTERLDALVSMRESLPHVREIELKRIIDREPRLADSIGVFGRKILLASGSRETSLTILHDYMWSILITLWDGKHLTRSADVIDMYADMNTIADENGKMSADKQLRSALGLINSLKSEVSRLRMALQIRDGTHCYLIESFLHIDIPPPTQSDEITLVQCELVDECAGEQVSSSDHQIMTDRCVVVDTLVGDTHTVFDSFVITDADPRLATNNSEAFTDGMCLVDELVGDHLNTSDSQVATDNLTRPVLSIQSLPSVTLSPLVTRRRELSIRQFQAANIVPDHLEMDELEQKDRDHKNRIDQLVQEMSEKQAVILTLNREVDRLDTIAKQTLILLERPRPFTGVSQSFEELSIRPMELPRMVDDATSQLTFLRNQETGMTPIEVISAIEQVPESAQVTPAEPVVDTKEMTRLRVELTQLHRVLGEFTQIGEEKRRRLTMCQFELDTDIHPFDVQSCGAETSGPGLIAGSDEVSQTVQKMGQFDEIEKLLEIEKEKTRKAIAETEKIKACLSELQKQLAALQELLREAGVTDEQISAAMTASGLKTILESSGNTVFDRLYKDAVDRMVRMSKIRHVVHEMEARHLERRLLGRSNSGMIVSAREHHGARHTEQILRNPGRRLSNRFLGGGYRANWRGSLNSYLGMRPHSAEPLITRKHTHSHQQTAHQ